MREVGVLEAKTHLSALLDQVEGGEELAITRHGKVVAHLKPVQGGAARRPRAEIAEDFRKLREEIAAKYGDAEGFDIKAAIEDGRA